MELMMRRLGMTTVPVENVEEVVIRTREKEHVFRAPEVTILTVQGVKTYQVVGTPEVRARGSTPTTVGAPLAPAVPSAPVGPAEEDIQLVMDQAGVDREEAVEALQQSDGAPAEAILAILSRRGTADG
jgi:nascent polypeptide-associated complex subunit alpha